MAEIVKLKDWLRIGGRSQFRSAEGESGDVKRGEIVMFTGVRYERLDDEAGEERRAACSGGRSSDRM